MKTAIAGAAACAALVLVGCSSPEAGSPVGDAPPETTQSTKPSQGAPNDTLPDGVPADTPRVANPIQNVEKFIQSPCDAVTKDLARQLKFDASIGEETEYSVGPTCELKNKFGDSLGITFNTSKHGIGGLYQNQSQNPNTYDYFEPTDVGGFPGVFAHFIDNRDNGMCGLAVGLTDTQVATVVGSIDDTPEVTNTCDMVKKFAEGAVATMSKG